MKFKALKSLTQEQIKQIRELEQSCLSFDGSGRSLFLSNDINYHKDMPCFFLCYVGEKLCGVLTVFAPTMETAEISGFVDPFHRRSGVFSRLLLESWQILHQYRITRLLIVTDAVSTICTKILNHWQAELSHSEYLLVYKGGNLRTEFVLASKCVVREAAESDFENMVALNMANFGEDRENASHMVRENFKHELTRCFVGQIDDDIFGLVNVRKEGSDFYICGFNIAPTQQGKGFGRYMLDQVLERLTPSDGESITLEVDSNNQPAYQLYTTSGFEVQSQADYYKLSLPMIKYPVSFQEE